MTTALKNRIIEWDGRKTRILETEPQTNIAWCIDLTGHKAMPFPLPLSEVAALRPITGQPGMPVTLAPHERTLMEKAWKCLQPLLQLCPDGQLFDPKLRKAAIERYASSLGCSQSSLYKYLRRYWQRGQVQAALIPDFRNCGPTNDSEAPKSTTQLRGRRTEEGIRPYQITAVDLGYMKDLVEDRLHKDQRLKVPDVYVELLHKHYMFTDGNGNQCPLPLGQRPTLRQFRYFYKLHFDLETRLRAKYGNKHFDKDLRPVLGIVGEDTPWAGHTFEMDATILPVTAVARHDRTYIVGKPTLYLLICRNSKLITGYYLGMEHASWPAAMMAVYSMVQDKQALCERYAVPYRAEDWPAHGVVPTEIVTDRGSEWTGKVSDDFVANTGVSVKTLPAARPDWKPYVENIHSLLQNRLRAFEPSYDPDSNAKARQNINYGKDACCNLDEMNGFILSFIIEYNNRILTGHRQSLDQLTSDFVATPVNLWNYSIAHHAGALTAYEEEQVRFQLLPRERGTITKEGLVFKGLTYTCELALRNKTFVKARNEGSIRVDVSFDPRLCDAVYVHGLDNSDVPAIATLAPASQLFEGLSFDEVRRIRAKRSQKNRLAEAELNQGRIELFARNKAIADKAHAEMKAATNGKARSTRRKDIDGNRKAERNLERKETSLVLPVKATVAAAAPTAFRSPIATTTSAHPTALPKRPKTISAMQAKLNAALAARQLSK